VTTWRSGSFQRGEHLGDLRVPALALLREHHAPVGDHVELALLARDDLGAVARSVDLGRETRSPPVVAASDGAKEDADVRHGRRL
jgi:hypothetical protein